MNLQKRKVGETRLSLSDLQIGCRLCRRSEVQENGANRGFKSLAGDGWIGRLQMRD